MERERTLSRGTEGRNRHSERGVGNGFSRGARDGSVSPVHR